MLILYNVDVPMGRLPMANWVLIGITCVISIPNLLMPGPTIADDPSNLPPVQQLLRQLETPPPPLSLQRDDFSVLQLVSYVFVHADAGHLLGNMIFLFVFGNAINAKLGHLRFLLLYFLLGAVAGVAWLLFGPGKVLIGASGAIMGIAGVFLVLYPRNDVKIFYLNMAGIGTSSIPSYCVLLLAMAFDLLGTFLGGGGGVAYACHLGGEGAGIAAAIGLLLGGQVKSTRDEENLLQALGIQESGRRFDQLGRRIRK